VPVCSCGESSLIHLAEIEKMRKQMEEEIRAQLMANQEMLNEAAGEGPSWEEKVKDVKGVTTEDKAPMESLD